MECNLEKLQENGDTVKDDKYVSNLEVDKDQLEGQYEGQVHTFDPPGV